MRADCCYVQTDKTALTVTAAPNDSPAAIDADALQREPLPPSWKARAKAFVAEYGAVGIATHTVISFAVIAIAYVCVSNGVNVGALLSAIGLEGDASKGSKAHAAGAFVIAYAIFKVLAPVRIPLTFAVTPVVMRALRQRGYMLPPSDAGASSLLSPTNREAAIEMV